MTNFDLDHSIRILSRTPGMLDRWLRDLPEEWIRATEGEGTWSPYQIIGHLIHGEETDWIPRLEHMMGGSADEPFDPFDREAMLEEDQDRPLKEILEEFARIRRANLRRVREFRLTEADMERTGTHPDLGEVTVRQLLATWTAHDLSHIAQIARVMAKRYREDVGPWREYLPILDR